MRLTVVGCSGSVPGPASPASCYLVEAGGAHRPYRLLLDLGSGSFGALHRHLDLYPDGDAPRSPVDAVLLSHLHPDHCADLAPYYVARRYGSPQALPPLPVYGPAHTRSRIASVADCTGADVDAQFAVREYPAAAFELGPFTVRALRVAHPGEAYGLRLEADGVALVYSGDTGPAPALVELARDADLLLAEAAIPAGTTGPPDLHLTGRQAGEHAAKAGVARLMITHVPPWASPELAAQEAREAFPGPVELAVAGETYDVVPGPGPGTGPGRGRVRA